MSDGGMDIMKVGKGASNFIIAKRTAGNINKLLGTLL